MIGRLDPQKGFDLLADASPDLLARGVRLVVQGSGPAALADPFREIAEAHPRQVGFIERFDRVMARKIYAGADFFAMPSRFEPCGQGQMISLRYGTPPIVHRVGGLADTVIDEVAHPGEGTGFAFTGASVAGLLAACDAAVGLRAAGGRGVGGLARSRDGGRLRLGDRGRRRATWTRTGGRSRSGATRANLPRLTNQIPRPGVTTPRDIGVAPHSLTGRAIGPDQRPFLLSASTFG